MPKNKCKYCGTLQKQEDVQPTARTAPDVSDQIILNECAEAWQEMLSERSTDKFMTYAKMLRKQRFWQKDLMQKDKKFQFP